ncbi:unnamed protein product [Lampetra fluviatilis]
MQSSERRRRRLIDQPGSLGLRLLVHIYSRLGKVRNGGVRVAHLPIACECTDPEMEKSIIATVETIANLLPAPARDAAAAAAHEKNPSGGVGNITAAAGFVPVAHRSSETDALRAARDCGDLADDGKEARG